MRDLIPKLTVVLLFVTFASIMQAQTPGNVSTDLKLWLKADANVTGTSPVTAWGDQTANGYDASAPANSPDLINNAINFNPAMDFTSTNS